jgi:hypothetical protein
MPSIEELLHRRSDLSTFLVHLTRDFGGQSARDNLLSIAKTMTIKAMTAYGPARDEEPHLSGSTASQKVVCFTETPLEHTWMMIQDIDTRRVPLSKYGLVFTRTTLRKSHCNPVWYTDITPQPGAAWLMVAVNEMIRQAVDDSTVEGGHVHPHVLSDHPIFKITPFIEQMGPTNDGKRKEFWWEREWRHVGDLYFGFPNHVVAFLAPAADHEALQKDLVAANDMRQLMPRPILDPAWGLERMIASLARVDPSDVGPFPM